MVDPGGERAQPPSRPQAHRRTRRHRRDREFAPRRGCRRAVQDGSGGLRHPDTWADTRLVAASVRSSRGPFGSAAQISGRFWFAKSRSHIEPRRAAGRQKGRRDRRRGDDHRARLDLQTRLDLQSRLALQRGRSGGVGRMSNVVNTTMSMNRRKLLRRRSRLFDRRYGPMIRRAAA
jgi:hypothetical protein